jgi:hypothetical protein
VAADGLGKAGNCGLNFKSLFDPPPLAMGLVIWVAVARPQRRVGRKSPIRAATNRKLTDRALNVEFDARHLRELIDIGSPNGASAEPHVARN